jgi:hypothetical protein
MKFLPVAACLCCATLQGAFLPVLHLDEKTLEAFDKYVATFEKDTLKPYTETGKLPSAGGGGCCSTHAFPAKPVLEPHLNADIANGSIHHFTGRIFIPGGVVDDMRHIMEDYPNYPKYFKPDVSMASGKLEPGSTPADEHYFAQLTLTESTLWFNVEYDCIYDTHYRRIDEDHWHSKSTTASVKELRDAKDRSKGFYPEGDDHGFVWRTNTYWFVTQAKDGIEVQLESLTLSRPNISGFSWWATKRSRDAVDKMLHDAKASVQAMHGK